VNRAKKNLLRAVRCARTAIAATTSFAIARLFGLLESYWAAIANANGKFFSASRRIAEIDRQLQQLKTNANRNAHKQSARPQIRAGAESNLAATSDPHRSTLKRKNPFR